MNNVEGNAEDGMEVVQHDEDEFIPSDYDDNNEDGNGDYAEGGANDDSADPVDNFVEGAAEGPAPDNDLQLSNDDSERENMERQYVLQCNNFSPNSSENTVDAGLQAALPRRSATKNNFMDTDEEAENTEGTCL